MQYRNRYVIMAAQVPHTESPGANPPFMLANAMFDYGITDDALLDGYTKASRIANEIFDNNFTSCMDKMYVEIYDDLN